MAEIAETFTLPVILSFRDTAKTAEKDLGSVFKGVGKKGSKEISDGFADGQAAFKKAADTYAKQYDKVQDAAGKLRKEEAALKQARESGARGDRVVALEERRNKALRDQQREVKAAQSAYKDLDGAQKRLRGGSDDADRGMSRLGSTLTGAAKSGAAFAAQAAAIGGVAVLGAVAVGAVKATRELYELGAQFDDMSDNIRVKTGAAGTELDKLTKSVENIARSTPASINTIGDVVAETRRNLHLTGTDLEGVSKTITNLNRITGDQTNMRDLGKAFRAFGVGAKDQEGVLNQLYTITQTTGIGVNDLLASLSKGGAQLRAFGLDAGQSAALLGTLEESGVDIDKVLAALSKSIPKFADDGLTPIQGLTQAITDIQNLPEAQARDLAAEVFGSKAGTQVFEQIRNGQLDVLNLNAALQSTPQSINAVAEATDDGAESWQKFKNNLEIALEPLANKVFDTASSGMDDLAKWASENGDEIIDFFVTLAQTTLQTGGAIATFVEGSLDVFALFVEQTSDKFGAVISVLGTGTREIGMILADIPGMDGLSKKLILTGAEAEVTGAALQSVSGNLREGADVAGATGDMFFSLSDKVGDLGVDMKDATGNSEDLNDGIGTVGSSAGAAAGEVENLSTQLDKLSKNKMTKTPMPTGSTGTPGASSSSGPAPTAGPSPGGTYGLPAGTNTGGYGTGDSGTFPPWVMDIADRFGIKPSTYPGHQEGNRNEPGYAPNPQGLNRGIDWTGPPEKLQAFADYLAANPGGLEQVIWQNPATGAATEIAGGKPQPGYFSGDLGGHQDHVHTRQSTPIPLPGGSTSTMPVSTGVGPPTSTMPTAGANWEAIAQGESGGKWDLNTGNGFFGGLQFTQQTWDAYKPPGAPARADLATKEQQIAAAEATLAAQGPGAWPDTFKPATPGMGMPGAAPNPNLTNAFGAGYEPGIGTPGYDEYGDPGYYEVDPTDVREAQQRIDDQMEAIRERDEAARQAQIDIGELESDATQAEKDAATERKRKADYDAGIARRELADLKGELSEAQKGKFSPAKEAKKQKGDKGGKGGELSEIGSIAGSFLKETFGVGSWLPDLFDNPFLKGADALVGSGLEMFNAYANGEWQPGGLLGDAMGTSSAPFGMPNIAAPPMPGGNQHPGTGTPGPPAIIDASTQINGNVGWSPDEIERRRRQNEARGVARVPAGS